MLKFNKEVRYLVQLKQKFLALLSRECGLHSARVESQVLSWLCSLEMRVFAIETVHRSRGSRTPRADDITLSKENLHDYLTILREDNLLKYKSSGT